MGCDAVTLQVTRAIISRILCLCHIGFSIYVLYDIKNREVIYLVPLFGAIFIIVEGFLILVFTKGKEPSTWFTPMFFIYVTTIVVCYWLLELNNINEQLLGKKVTYDYNRYSYRVNDQEISGVSSWIRVIWSSLELQIFFALLLIIRWILPKSNLSPQDLADLLIKYFVISCDMLDFLTILQDDILIKSMNLMYATLSIWTWSTFQFFIYVPTYEVEEKREFSAYISNSLLSVIFMDTPYLCLRLVAIFGFGSHNYNSYYFVVKNILMILLQIFRIRAAFQSRQMKDDRKVSILKKGHGIDQGPAKIFDQNKMAQQNMSNYFNKNNQENNYINQNDVQISMHNSDEQLQVNTKMNSLRPNDQLNHIQVSPRNPLVNRLPENQNLGREARGYMNGEDQHTLMNHQPQNQSNILNSRNLRS